MKANLLHTAILLSALSAGSLQADIVYLRDGKSIEGKITLNEEENTYRIETTRGAVIKPVRDVQRIVKAPLPQEVFIKRFETIDRTSLDDLAGLATWAREKYLIPQKQKICKL
ncbi:MAG: hypothetical protein VYC32_12135, partial [Planctomycetota bacterium]|nr:hypothetical protein [Planctomycetota bacterium]